MMKKLTLLMAAAFIAAVALTGCAPSTESSSWLNGTTWSADLAGVTYRDYGRMGYFDDEIVPEGSIRIHFNAGGFNLYIDTNYLKERLIAGVGPDYDYPSLYIPISWEEENDTPVNIIYNVGTMSEDFKTIHFDTFRTKGHDWGDYRSYTEFIDLTLTRK